MAMGRRYHDASSRTSDRRSFVVWCFEPAEQFDPDIATNPRLSPPPPGEHAWQTMASFDVFRRRVAWRGNYGDDLSLLCRTRHPQEDRRGRVRRVEPTGRVRDWVQTFGTMTGELLALGYTRKPETAQHPSKSIRVPERARERPRRGLTGMSLI